MSLELFLRGDQAIDKPLAVGHVRCTSWPLLMLDLIPVSVGLCVVNCCGGARWWGERDRRSMCRRTDGGVVVRGKQGVIIAVVI